ncbi:MAG: hypothetical protein IPJ00_05710 [Saprospirales bacterium]|nr:hypothetical protein [Saprospirales bacterium]
MEEVLELIRLISRNKIKQLGWADPKGSRSHSPQDGQIQRLYDGVTKGILENEGDVATFFYRNSARKLQYARRLIQKLRARLLNTLFYIDLNQPKFNDAQRAYYQSHKDYALCKILIGHDLVAPFISQAEETLKNTLHFGFPYLSMELARNLMTNYGLSGIDNKRALHYKSLMFQQLEFYQAEIKTEVYFQEFAVHFSKSRSSKPEIAKIAKQYAEEVEEYFKHFQTYRLVLNGYSVLSMRFQIENDYENTIVVSRRALDVIENDATLNTKTALLIFSFNILQSCIQLRRFEEGEQAAQKCLKLVPEGTNNWFCFRAPPHASISYK